MELIVIRVTYINKIINGNEYNNISVQITVKNGATAIINRNKYIILPPFTKPNFFLKKYNITRTNNRNKTRII